MSDGGHYCRSSITSCFLIAESGVLSSAPGRFTGQFLQFWIIVQPPDVGGTILPTTMIVKAATTELVLSQLLPGRYGPEVILLEKTADLSFALPFRTRSD
ncbi:hypothetical protein ARMGADRAFT_479566 [Armillaria gallica]|uniref:Uncharacterized protein n=1 Tax=Armillaria gallica TaxID=47427 RepID=A0A2H3DH18_ARMGA|nr:hypothetical protein ARMGADRAFT_479566 [Armillaria gallica]